MLIREAIKRADKILPNHFSREEKLNICHELSSKLRREVKKEYGSVVFKKGEKIRLPQGVSVADIRAVISDGRVMRRVDYDKLPEASPSFTEIIYLTVPSPYRSESYSLPSVSDGCELYLSEIPPCSEGDFILTESGEARILRIFEDRLLLSEELISDRDTLSFEIEPAWKTECEAPYDTMYVEYLLSRLLYLGQNFDASNHYTAEFNAKLRACQCYYKANDTVMQKKHFNLW